MLRSLKQTRILHFYDVPVSGAGQVPGFRAMLGKEIAESHSSMQHITFFLDLNASQCEGYYAGRIRYVQVQSDDGRQIRFPASALLPYIGHYGVCGRFVLRLGEGNRLIALERLD